MSRQPHPFTEVPDWRAGYRTFEFEFDGMLLRLMTVPEQQGDPAKSLVFEDRGSAVTGRALNFYFPSLTGALSVETVVEILRFRANEFERGRVAGIAEAQRDVRKALGL